MNLILFNFILVLYLLVIGFLGFLGYRNTKTSKDFLIAGRQIHPYIMAISYGATFISTSAIVGFGGAAGVFGMSVLWLTFLNIAFGIALAFILFGKRTRKLGRNMDARTFPEFLGKRYNSKFIQRFGGIVIFLFMPLYAGVVLIGAARFIESTLNINFSLALFVFSIIIAAYVIAGGLKGVMYTDALQGTIMFIGMLFLLIFIYMSLGGFTSAHQSLTDIADKVPAPLIEQGHQGWTAMPRLGTPLWWTVISTIVAGVGIGVLAQPQLVVRFMTVKSNKELNRAVLIGGIFILFMTGVAFLGGALSNSYFFQQLGQISLQVTEGNSDLIIPTFINMAMPSWFVYIFMLTLLAAAMSTISSQFHTMGTSFSRDVFGKNAYDSIEDDTNNRSGLLLAKIGIVIGIIISVVLGYYLPIGVIAKGTAVFFGVCAATFLPMYVFALYWKGATKAGAVSGMIVGVLSSVIWMLFIHTSTSAGLRISNFIFGVDGLLPYPWSAVDPIFIAFPLAFIVTFLVSLFTKKLPPAIIEKSFATEKEE
jgi:solute:Na+ symporter, SSS family